MDSGDGSIRINHLQCDVKDLNIAWVAPRADDIQDVLPEQIIPVEVVGKWAFYEHRVPNFVINNVGEIEAIVKDTS